MVNELTVSLPPMVSVPLLKLTVAVSARRLAASVVNVPPLMVKAEEDIATTVESWPAVTVVVPV